MGRAHPCSTRMCPLLPSPTLVPAVVELANIWHVEDPGNTLGPKSVNCWKPVIAAVHGMAAGGAFYWLNESDIIICSEDATFFDPHVTYGMTSALEPIGMTYHMPLQDRKSTRLNSSH